MTFEQTEPPEREVALIVTKTMTSRPIQTFVLVGATLALILGFSIVGAGEASAASSYVSCPVNEPNVGCGFEGGVGPGSYIITFRFKRTSGGYGSETHSFTCAKDYCPVWHYAVRDPDRMPAGFDISSDSLFTSFGEFV